MAIDNHTPNNFHFATYSHVKGTIVQDATKVAYSDSLLIIKHIRAKPSALSQHPSHLLARVILSTRARGSRNAACCSCSRPRPAPLGAGRGREYENI